MKDDGRPKLTAKQTRFAAAYVETGNGTRAARIAGYKGDDNQLAVQASVNLRNPKIQQLIADSLLAPAMMAVREALVATKSRHFCHEGEIISTAPEPDHHIRLQAADRVFKALSKAGAGAPEPDAHGDTVQLEDLDPAQLALLREADAIQAELKESEASRDGAEPPPIKASDAPSQQVEGENHEYAFMRDLSDDELVGHASNEAAGYAASQKEDLPPAAQELLEVNDIPAELAHTECCSGDNAGLQQNDHAGQAGDLRKEGQELDLGSEGDNRENS